MWRARDYKMGHTIAHVRLLINSGTYKHFQARRGNKHGAKRTECSSADHVVDTAGSSYNDVYTVGQSMQVLAYCSATDACLALGIHVVA